jgi:MFS family permease
MRRVAVNVLAFAGGFAVMALELLGGRMLAPYFGNSIYVWGSVISVFMVSLALGYLAGGWWSLRRASIAKFALIFVAAAIAFAPLVTIAEPTMQWVFARIEDPRYGSLLAASALFVLPTAVLGAVSPYSVRLLVEATQRSGHVAGSLYFVSTVGSALGTLLTSFYFVLWWEIDSIIALLAGALLALGVATFAGALVADRIAERPAR